MSVILRSASCHGENCWICEDCVPQTGTWTVLLCSTDTRSLEVRTSVAAVVLYAVDLRDSVLDERWHLKH